MQHLMQEADTFSKINWACAVTLNPLVGFGKCVFGNNYIPIYLKNAIGSSIFFVWKCAWWGNAENGEGGKEMVFFLLESNKLVKMHSDGKRIHLAFNIY